MNPVTLFDTERIDELISKQLYIIQSDEVFSFSIDAVLLARFCTVPTKGKVLDLCSGNGVIPLLLSTRTKAVITAVEIQERLVDMAKRSVELNQLEQQIVVMHEDLRLLHEKLKNERFDLITVNPPYLPAERGAKNRNPYVARARHEIDSNLEQVIVACSRQVKSGGKVALVHRPSRIADIMGLLRQYRLEPKRIQFVHPNVGAEANMVLIEASKDGKPEVRLLPPLIVYNEDNEYTKEIYEIYNGKKVRDEDAEHSAQL